ncbi:MAG: manganese efflux pump MntP family protein [Lachnospiraceae bacterium]|nr:manganese efflux pump MntP family protein [Lachnospiraceae bacterium]
MSPLEIFLTGIGLSMDAFAVSICKGLGMKKMDWKKACIAGLYFGGFQALMPFLGWAVGTNLYNVIERFDHWIVFFLLLFVGASMIKEAFGEDEKADDDFSFRTMLLLAVATSIDALAVGVSFAMLKVNIWLAITIIGCTTFVFGAVGVKVGNVFGTRYRAKAEFTGGVILILIGLKVLLEHLGVLA